MDYEKLKGQIVKLNGREVEIKAIREIEGIHSNTYEVNNSYSYSSETIFGAIIEVEAKERSGESLGFFAKLLVTYGLFFSKKVFTNETRLGSVLGFRSYGYHKCSFYMEFNFGKKAFVLEFVFKDKNLYRPGQFPRENVGLKKLI